QPDGRWFSLAAGCPGRRADSWRRPRRGCPRRGAGGGILCCAWRPGLRAALTATRRNRRGSSSAPTPRQHESGQAVDCRRVGVAADAAPAGKGLLSVPVARTRPGGASPERALGGVVRPLHLESRSCLQTLRYAQHRGATCRADQVIWSRTAANAVAAVWRSSRLCAADTCVLIRALPTGTTG